jgi:hypothetical protein
MTRQSFLEYDGSKPEPWTNTAIALWPCGTYCETKEVEEYLRFMSDDYLVTTLRELSDADDYVENNLMFSDLTGTDVLFQRA